MTKLDRHDIMPVMTKAGTPDDWYEEKVDRSAGPSACHPWIGGLNSFGYGSFAHNGESLAVRWAYKRWIGPLEKGEVIRHSCDNRSCQNPQHWIKGTQAQNIYDAVSRGRQHRPTGEKNVRAKLTETNVLSIRESRISNIDIARIYGVDPCTVSSIRTRKTWRHI